MSDTTAAILILPTLAALVLVLECSRLGCTRLHRQLQKAPTLRERRSSETSSSVSAL